MLQTCEMLRSGCADKCEQLVLAIVRKACIFISFKSGLRKKVGPNGVNSLTFVTGCSLPAVLGMKNANIYEEETALNVTKEHLSTNKENFTLYLLSRKESELLHNRMSLERVDILDAESKLVDSYVAKCNNSLLQMLLIHLISVEFMSKVDMVVDICIDREIARFYGSMERGFEALRDRIKATAITVTETATESSATLGIESAAQALGQAAIGVGITIMVDLALTSHSLYKAKKAKDMGLIDDKQFETKVKKKVCESGCQFIGGTTGSVVGQLVIPIPVVGAFVGGLCGSLIGTGIGKGVNYGLFERKGSPSSDRESAAEFGLVASVLNTIKDRNPATMISFVEKDNIFVEIAFITKSNDAQSSSKDKSFFMTRYLSERKSSKNETLKQSSDSCSKENAVTGWRRRYSDSVGIIQRRAKSAKSGGKLNREDSLSASCLDRCCEELTEDNDDNGADATAITNTLENKSAGQVLSKNTQETKIALKESLRPEAPCSEKNVMKILKSFDAINEATEKSDFSKQKNNETSQEENEETATETVKWNSSFFVRRMDSRKRREAVREEKGDGDLRFESDKGKCDAKEADAGNEDSDARNIFRAATFEKLTSIWKGKANIPEPGQSDNKKSTNKVLNSDFMRKLINIVHKKDDHDASEKSMGEIETSNDEMRREGDTYDECSHTMSGFNGRNEEMNDELKDERMLFFTRHAAYGIKIRELAQIVNEKNTVPHGATIHTTNELNNDEACGEESGNCQITFQPKNEDDTRKEQNCMQGSHEYQISSFAKEFISKLKRNIRQRQKKREEYTESQEHCSKTEIDQQ